MTIAVIILISVIILGFIMSHVSEKIYQNERNSGKIKSISELRFTIQESNENPYG